MEHNLNYNGIENYCKTLATKVCEASYTNKAALSGKEILSLTPVKQINLFVIKNLFTAWTKEADNVRSPYFDYSSDDVQQALSHFMNILSQHISVKKNDMMPLLEAAIKESILLIFSPYNFYTHLISGKESLSFEELQSIAKYIKVNQDIFNALLDKMKREKLSSIDHDKMNKLFNDIFEHTNASPEDIQPYLTQLDEMHTIDETLIYGETEKAASDESEVIESKEPVESDSEQATINERFEDSPKVINDEHAEEIKTTLADIHKNQKIESIEKHLSINQRFMFIRALFGGDESLFKNTLHQLESFESKKAAFEYLDENYSDWDLESEEVEEFMEVVEKRFN